MTTNSYVVGGSDGHQEAALPLITVESLTEAMKTEVRWMIKEGRVPPTIYSFSDLHDYCDANCLAGLCSDAVFDRLVEIHGGHDEHDGIPQGMLDVINEAQDNVGKWLAKGQP